MLMTELLRPEGLDLCAKMLDYAALRHKVVANNIANINTPNFRRSDVEFAQELDRVLREKGIEGVRNLRLRVTKPNETPIRADGNNASVDKDMAVLAENAITYQIYAQLIARKFRKIREILREA
jgi:flagellar basal-body rod protein FlgB